MLGAPGDDARGAWGLFRGGGLAVTLAGAFSAHPSACIDQPCEIGAGTRIWHFCHVMSGARIGSGCVLGQNVFVAGSAILGDRVRVQNNVSIYDGVEIEDDVFLGPSCVLTNVAEPPSGDPPARPLRGDAHPSRRDDRRQRHPRVRRHRRPPRLRRRRARS